MSSKPLPPYGVPDEENPEWTAEEIRTAKPFAEVFPGAALAIRRSRGPQKAPTKQMVSIRLDVDVLNAFRATGRGWQGRINHTLAVHAPQARRRVTKTSRRSPSTAQKRSR
jgi:uncharacterized protein (DUF4415 family)